MDKEIKYKCLHAECGEMICNCGVSHVPLNYENSEQVYTEEDLRKAFRTGDRYGREDYCGDSRDYFNEDEYIESLKTEANDK